MAKGAISIPPYLVAVMIATIIAIAVGYLFISGAGQAILSGFKELSTKTLKNMICGIVGSLPIIGGMC